MISLYFGHPCMKRLYGKSSMDEKTVRETDSTIKRTVQDYYQNNQKTATG